MRPGLPLLAFGAVIFALSTSPASAYLDPGAGSMALQALIAAFAGAAAFFGYYRQKITDFFRKKRSDD